MMPPNHRQAARELRRVCRPGGRIALASWTPEGFIGDLSFASSAATYRPRLARARLSSGAPMTTLRNLFPDVAKDRAHRWHFTFRYQIAEHFIDVFRTYDGPVHTAFASLDAARQQMLEAEMRALLQRANEGGVASLVVPVCTSNRDHGLIRSCHTRQIALESTMKFAKIVFFTAGTWGITVVTPLFFLLDVTGRRYDPPTSYPHFFYGFLAVVIAWQVAFLAIGSNPWCDSGC